jgi:MYXO-CTERM domain-containing protein
MLLSAGAASLAVISGGVTHATVYEYSYTGMNYTSLSDNGSVPGAYTTSMDVSGYFTLSTPLAANSSGNIAGSILDWSFSDGRNTLTKAGQTSYPDAFYISTNAAGAIYAWIVNLQAVANNQFNASTTDPNMFSDGSSTGGFDDAYTTGTCLSFNSSSGCANYNADIASVGQAGIWAVTTVAVAEPASLPIMAAGMGGLALLARRRRRQIAKI